MIPAICSKCGLVFPSGVGGAPGARFRIESVSASCPRCWSSAPVLDGYYEILEDAVRLVQQPDFTRETAKALALEAQKLQRNTAEAQAASGRIRKTHPAAADRFALWSSIGANFAVAMATVVSALLVHMENRANAPLMERAVEALEDFSRHQPQPDLRAHRLSVAPTTSIRPTARPHSKEKLRVDHPKQSDCQAATPEPKLENRRIRRAKRATSSRKSRKPVRRP